jgi:hypothetical protein
MKSAAPTTVPKTLPSVPPLVPATSGLTNEEFSALMDPQALIPTGLSTYLDLLRNENPKTLPLIGELLTTGNKTGRKLAARKFTSILSEIANSYMANPANWTRGISQKFGSPVIESEVAKNWAIGNVAEELGIEMKSDRDYHNLHGPTANMHFLQGMANSASMTTSYWRGIIAFNRTTIGWSKENRKEIKAFVLWAGEQDDLLAVIDLASERNILDVDTLAGVLKERESSSPVRDGVL